MLPKKTTRVTESCSDELRLNNMSRKRKSTARQDDQLPNKSKPLTQPEQDVTKTMESQNTQDVKSTKRENHFRVALLAALLLSLVLLVVVNQFTGDGKAQNPMEIFQELKGLIPEEWFMDFECFLEDHVSNVPDSHTYVSKFLVLWKEYCISRKQKSDGGEECSSSRSATPVKVKLYSVVTGQTVGAHQVLLEKLKNLEWTMVTIETTSYLQESHVVIVFCPITSRVGSDVEAAMADIKGSYLQKPVILVVMHHTRDVEYSTNGRRWSDMYDNVVLDVHVLFHETTGGLLTCPKNDQAVSQIHKELEKAAPSSQ